MAPELCQERRYPQLSYILSFGAFGKLELRLKVKVVSYFQEEAITVID